MGKVSMRQFNESHNNLNVVSYKYISQFPFKIEIL